MSALTQSSAAITAQRLDRLQRGALALLLGLPLLAQVSSDLWLRLFILLAVGWAIPGLFLARAWRLPHAPRPAFLLAAWGLGFCWLMAGAIVAHYLPGPLREWQLWAVYLVGGALIAFAPAREEAYGPTPRAVWIGGAGLFAVAALLRVPGLGYHEFHTDEVVLLRQAGASIQGALTALAEHTKGPGEIAITLAVYRALGAIDEGTARLPFALMSVGSTLATAWLGYRLFAPTPSDARREQLARHTGLWAGLLLACNGFALGLSRIAQYQPGVLLLSALAVWAMWEFANSSRPQWLTLAGAFSAFGMVLHYEFGLLAPALLWLAWLGVKRHPAPGALRRSFLLTAGAGAALLGVAYIPPLFNPYFSTTQTYLSNRLGGTLVFNGPFFVEMGTFYNSTYFFFGLMGLMLLGIGLGVRRGLGIERLAVLLLCVWWLPFFILYVFIVRYPGTHFYQMMTAWSLLAAIPLAAWTAAVGPLLRGQNGHAPGAKAWLLGIAGALIAVWLAVSVFYLYLLFFRQDPEYLVNHEREGLALYWAPYPVPQKPRFGFPIHAGWKTIGVLGEWGYLSGTYSSNDRSWGLRNWYRSPLTWIEEPDGETPPDYIFAVHHVQEENLYYHSGYQATYHRAGEVRFRGEPRIELWVREPLPAPYLTFEAESFDLLFREHLTRLDAPLGQVRRGIDDGRLGQEFELAAAHLPAAGFQRGEVAHITLEWRVSAQPRRDYKLFVHVAGDQGMPAAQWDGFPGLNTAFTSAWNPGLEFVDHVLLEIPADIPSGEYALLAGLYDPESGNRVGDRGVEITRLTLP